VYPDDVLGIDLAEFERDRRARVPTLRGVVPVPEPGHQLGSGGGDAVGGPPAAPAAMLAHEASSTRAAFGGRNRAGVDDQVRGHRGYPAYVQAAIRHLDPEQVLADRSS
jgi:hypothetical protein